MEDSSILYLNINLNKKRRYMGGPVGYASFKSSSKNTKVTIFYDHHTTIGPAGDITQSQTQHTASMILNTLKNRQENLLILLENMEETELYGDVMKHLMQNAPKTIPQRIRYLQLMTRENIEMSPMIQMRSIEARSQLLLASRYWANNKNPIVMSTETKLLIEKLLADITLHQIWTTALSEINITLEKFSHIHWKKANPIQEIQNKLNHTYHDLKLHLGSEYDIIFNTPLIQLSGNLLNKLEGWTTGEIDTDFLYQLVDLRSLAEIMESERDVIEFVGISHAEVIVDYLENWVEGWTLLEKKIPSVEEVEGDYVVLIKDEKIKELLLFPSNHRIL